MKIENRPGAEEHQADPGSEEKDKHVDELKKFEAFWNYANYAYIVAAILAVGATVAIWNFSNRVAELKRIQLEAYKAESVARIEEARSLAEQARVESSELLVKLDQERIKLARLQLELYELGERSTSAEQAALEARDRVVAVEANSKPRTISAEQATLISERLQEFAGSKLEIQRISSDAEASHFSQSLASAIGAAGIEVSIVTAHNVDGFGVGLAGPRGWKLTPFSAGLLRTFQEAGVPMALVNIDTEALSSPSGFFLFVGEKWSPDQGR